MNTRNEVEKIRELKGNLGWTDAVGASFDVLFDKLLFDAVKMDESISFLDGKMHEVMNVLSRENIEETYTKLMRAYSEAEA